MLRLIGQGNQGSCDRGGFRSPDQACGRLLGFRHLTFYANGPVGWVEEILVRGEHRGRGVGRALMGAFERWASDRDCVLVALATRRAASFYRALGYQELATYLRKMLRDEPTE
ncbi:MAG TPA: GNAT family N-acetyltransferase [Streptosporangiaceae bacterium]|nr:GNAT family N-acetyltransferase [Streptosporangiaceae bacterium]